MNRRQRRLSRLSLRKHFRKSLKHDYVERTIPNRSLSIISISSTDAETSEEDNLSLSNSHNTEIISPSPDKNRNLKCLSIGTPQSLLKTKTSGNINGLDKDKYLEKNDQDFSVLNYDHFETRLKTPNDLINSTMLYKDEVVINITDKDSESVDKSGESLLDELYGDSWRPHKDKIFPKTERKPTKKQIILQQKGITERKKKRPEAYDMENVKFKSQDLLKNLQIKRMHEIEQPSSVKNAETDNTKNSVAHLLRKARNKLNFDEDEELKNNEGNLWSDKENSIVLLPLEQRLKKKFYDRNPNDVIEKQEIPPGGSPNGSYCSPGTKKAISSNQEYASSPEIIMRNIWGDKSKKKKIPRKILDSSSSDEESPCATKIPSNGKYVKSPEISTRKNSGNDLKKDSGSSSPKEDCQEEKTQKNKDEKKCKDTLNKYQGPEPSKKNSNEDNNKEAEEKNENLKQNNIDIEKKLPKSLKKKALINKVNKYKDDVDTNSKKKNLKTNNKKNLGCFESSTDTEDSVENSDESDSTERNQNCKTYSFLASLSCNVPNDKCDPSARIYKENFKNTREALTIKLLDLYNKHIFNNAIPKETQVKWNPRLTCTAGYCATKRIIHKNGKIDYEAQIVLSTKVLTTPERLRDTLVHELCHAVTWLVDKIKDGHGSHWIAWTKKARIAFPELPPIKRCHSYEIHSKYVYKCSGCGYSIKRHRKSLDIERKRCGYCHGKFEIFINKPSKNGQHKLIPAETPKKPAKGFALFVQENHSKYKNQNSANVMRLLSKEFKELKLKNDILEEAPKMTDV